MFDRLSLRSILLVDGIVSGAMGLLLIASASVLDSVFDLPVAFLRGLGVVLLPWFALLAVVATRTVIRRTAVRFVIAVNLGWVAASILLLFTGWVEPNALGIAFIIVQAMAVVVFALAQIAKQVEAAPASSAQPNRGFQV
jgi:hypothetical protein